MNITDNKWIDELLKYYTDHLKNVILPFWLKNGIDFEFGGCFTCFDNIDGTLISTDKFTWSQGRVVWIMAKLSTLDIFSEEERKEFLAYSKKAAEFLMKNCRLENGNCTFVMTREGNPKAMNPGDPFDLGIEADMFAVLGIARYSQVSGDFNAYNFASELFRHIKGRIETGTAVSYPYPMPAGFKGAPMMMLNLSHELALAADRFDKKAAKMFDDLANSCMNEILGPFISKDYVAHEKITPDNQFDEKTLMGRYVNPGHTIEDMWFVIHQALRAKNEMAEKKALKIAKKALEIGWDNEFGGFLLFVDQDGGKPKGSIEGMENEVMVHKVLNDWDSKLWWIHSEALYTTLLAFNLSKDAYYLETYSKVHDYTFKTFPNPDKAVGEWIHIRDRKGAPQEKIVALPVKDPFHIIRNFALIINLLQEMKEMKDFKTDFIF